jgi:hypothetical protein
MQAFKHWLISQFINLPPAPALEQAAQELAQAEIDLLNVQTAREDVRVEAARLQERDGVLRSRIYRLKADLAAAETTNEAKPSATLHTLSKS